VADCIELFFDSLTREAEHTRALQVDPGIVGTLRRNSMPGDMTDDLVDLPFPDLYLE
jgi:hypothetical protein